MLFQSAGITVGLLFTALAFRQNAEVERVKLLFELKEHHASMWRELFDEPKLARVLDPAADLETDPLSAREEVFLGLLILHLACAFESIQADLLSPSGVEEAIRDFFSLPLPWAIWEKGRGFRTRPSFSSWNRRFRRLRRDIKLPVLPEAACACAETRSRC